jgi:uncharacterized surface protein with fasciclin (FAS1) repeats
MKIISTLKKGLLLLALSTIITSCDENNSTVSDGTITAIAASSRDFDILTEALNEVNLAETLRGTGPYTVFAPTDEAFAKFLRTTPYKTIKEVPKNILTQILLNHVVSGSFLSTALSTGYKKTLAKNTVSGTNTMSMYIDVNPLTKEVMINGVAKVETTNIIATNGVIHVVDKVINLPTIVTHATANKNFTSLVGALTGAGQPDFVGILSGTGPFTVFAPTNDAFTSLNTELVGGIAGVSVPNLTKVLQYHVVNGSVLSSSLTEGLLPTLVNQNFTVSLTGGPKIIDVNKRTSNIIAADVQCSNGVIHVLDMVLLPKL